MIEGGIDMKKISKKLRAILLLISIVTITLFMCLPTVSFAEVALLPGFKTKVILSGSPLANIAGLSISSDGKLYISDTGIPIHSGQQKILVIDIASATVSTLVSGLPLGFPSRMLIGDGRPLVGTDLIVADQNADTGSPCCNGRVFRIDRQTGDVTVLSIGSPGVPFGDPLGLALGSGGGFGTGLYVMDFQGDSPYPPFLYIINSDGSRSVFLEKPEVWTVDTFPMHMVFGAGNFGNNLYVTNAAFAYPNSTTPTIWRVTPQAEINSFVEGLPLKHPVALRFGPGGPFGPELYVLDIGDDGIGSIYKISADGKIYPFITGLAANTFPSLPDFVFAPDGKSMFIGIGDKIVQILPEEQYDTCQNELLVARQLIQDLQNQITALTAQNSQLQDQVNILNQENQTLTNGLLSGLNSVEQNFQQVFNDPQFEISGITLLEKFQSLVNAILQLEKGRKEGIYTNLGGKPGK